MDLFDTLALLCRRYEPRKSLQSGGRRFTLSEVLEMFDRQGILELTPYQAGHALPTLRPDSQRKLKVSLLDSISDIHGGPQGWFEVLQTAPTGDVSRVKIVSHSPDNATTGEIRMLVGRRSYEHYFSEDPILQEISRQG